MEKEARVEKEAKDPKAGESSAKTATTTMTATPLRLLKTQSMAQVAPMAAKNLPVTTTKMPTEREAAVRKPVLLD